MSRPKKKNAPIQGLSRRSDLLIAAGKLFAEQGFTKAGMRQIAIRAGVAVHTVTYHFGSKKALFAECLRHALEDRVRYHEMFAPPSTLPSTARSAATAVKEKIEECFRAFYARHEDQWQGGVLVQTMMSRQPDAMAAMSAMLDASRGWFLPIVRIVKPDLDDKQFFYWHMSLWAEISFYTMARPLLLRRLKNLKYDETTLAAGACHIAALMLAGLKKPEIHEP